jgi:hypothetical protein
MSADCLLFMGYIAGFVTAGWILPAIGKWAKSDKKKGDGKDDT